MFGPVIVLHVPIYLAVFFVWTLFAILNASYVTNGLARNLGRFGTTVLILSGPVGSFLFILPAIFWRR